LFFEAKFGEETNVKKLVLIATLFVFAMPVVQAQIQTNCGDGGCNPGTPFEECKRLAALHQYELVLRRRDGETFTSYVRRFLSITHYCGAKLHRN
jgi:hypothetical protein